MFIKIIGSFDALEMWQLQQNSMQNDASFKKKNKRIIGNWRANTLLTDHAGNMLEEYH